MTESDPAALKLAAAVRALEFVEEGMKLGLGTGSTAEAFLDVLAPRIKGGLSVTGVPTSERTAQKARGLGIPLATLEQLGELDLTVDGADEADRNLHLIKGAGAALLREKIVAASSKRMVVIADGSKLVERLGKFPLPIEVTAFGHASTARRIALRAAALGYRDLAVTLRMKDGEPVKTDGGNLVYDAAFSAIADAPALASALSDIAGVADHGLFIGLATHLVIARADGVEIIPPLAE